MDLLAPPQGTMGAVQPQGKHNVVRVMSIGVRAANDRWIVCYNKSLSLQHVYGAAMFLVKQVIVVRVTR